jgi:hypothetical protein
MTDNIFNQSFESLLQSVGVASETPAQEPAPTPEPTPVQESPLVDDSAPSIFDQFQLPDEVKTEEPVENKTEEYKVDMDIFGAQDVAPSVAPTEVKQEEIESAQPVVETKPESKPEPKPKAKKSPAKKKAKAETTVDLKSEGLIDADTVAAIEEEIDIIVKKALRKSIVKNLKAIADEM